MTPQGVPATSKRNRARRATAVTTAPAASPAAKDPPPDILRRLLLVLVCVLVVARPLVGSEHPGLVSDFSDPGGMVLTFLTFLACAGWVGWRAWRGETPLYFGWVDLAFLALALAVFLGATHASYKRPAWLAGWDWVGLALLVLLVRQLAVRPEERHGLVALLLASVVALAGEALFQAFYTLPKQHTAIEAFISEESSSSPDQFLPQQMAVRGITPTPLEMFELQRRLDGSQVYGPYYHPESLAAVLALAIPLLFGAVFACIRGGGAGWQMSLASFALVLAAAALACTKCWPAMAAVWIVTALAGGLAWPARMGGRKVGLPLGLLAAGAGVVALGANGVFETSIVRIREVWPAAWTLILDHPVLGVGPAQFALFYPRYMAETAAVKAVSAGNAVLELWVEAGVFGVVALAALVLLFASAVWRWWHTAPSSQKPETHTAGSPDEPLVAWEFYLGGMIGLVLAFILRAGHLPTEDIIPEAIAAGLRAIVWFAAFGVFESIAWSNEEHVGSLTAGVSAMFLCLLVQSGIDFPSVSLFLWVAVALILAVVTPEPAGKLSRLPAVNALAVPALLGIAFAYFALVFYPASASVTALRRSQQAGAFFLSEMDKPAKLRSSAFDPIAQLGRAIGPLEGATREDPDNVRLLVSLSTWYSYLARYSAPTAEVNPAQLALFAARKARKANPEGAEGYLAEYIWCLNFARTLLAEADALEKEKPDPKRPTAAADRTREATRRRLTAKRLNGEAAQALEAYYRKRDPNDPVIRYLLAEALFGEDRVPDAIEQARQAKRLDDAAMRPGDEGPQRTPRSLSKQQRQQVEEWLKRGSAK